MFDHYYYILFHVRHLFIVIENKKQMDDILHVFVFLYIIELSNKNKWKFEIKMNPILNGTGEQLNLLMTKS